MNIRLLLHIIILLHAHFIFAQIFPYRNYYSDGELANSNVYAITQDAEGYIWFATDNGLSRFDGSKSNNYGIESGLPVNAILSVATDASGNIYAGAKRKGIYKFAGTKFSRVIEDTTSILSNHTITAGNTFFYSLRRMHKITAIHMHDKSAGEVQLPEKVKPVCLYEDAAGNMFSGTTDGLFKIENTTATKIFLPELEAQTILHICEYDGKLCIAASNKIFIVSNGIAEEKIHIKEIQDEDIQNFLIDKNQNLWFTTASSNRFYVYVQNKLIRLDETLQLNGAPVTGFMADNEGNIWVTTFGKGVFCFYNLFCTNYTEQHGLTVPFITSLETGRENDVFLGTTNGIFYFDGNAFVQIKQNNTSREHIAQLQFANNRIYASKAISANEQNKPAEIPGYEIEYKDASALLVQKQHTTIVGKWSNKVIVQRNGKTDSVLLDPHFRSNKVTALYETTAGEILCGTTNGLYKIFTDNRVEKFMQEDLNTSITCIAPHKSGTLWIGTLTGIVGMKNDEIQFSWKPGIKDATTVTSIVFDNKNRTWAGTLKGVYLISSTDKYFLFDSKTCLLNNEVSCLTYDAKRNIMWVGTNGGLSKIDVSAFDALQTFRPLAIFKNLRTQDATTRLTSDITLPYNRNNFTVRFSAIHFTNPAGVRFQFKLDNANWQQLSGKQLELAGLSYGEHIISIVAENDRGEQGAVNSLNITIQTPFWATWWFRTLLVFMAAAVAFFIIRWRFLYEKSKQKEQLELQNRIAELRHQALNASMNPHFIFNSLNSIQQYINTHEPEEASEYLGKFARLIRLQLNNGNKTFITLEEELDRLNRYLELEKIRFGEKLKYTIQLLDKIDIKNTQLPNMLLQPFVENALWHGILPTGKTGNISIRFSKQNGCLLVLIDDDGIGIRESENRKKDNHRSLGMQMILERIQLLKKLDGNDIRITVKDRSETDAQQHGTAVEIQIDISRELAGTLLP